MKIIIKVLFALALMGAWSPAFADDASASLKITIGNLPNSKGTLNYLVFNKEDGFPDKLARAVRAGHVEIPADLKLSFVIDHLEPGEYAISVYQDQNSNGKLDTGFMGIPKEPVGASNNPKSRMGPPRYDDARFQVTAPGGTQPQEISINLVHG